MSSTSLLAFLNKLTTELDRNSDVWRKRTGNKLAHKFIYRSSHIRKAIDSIIASAFNIGGVKKQEGVTSTKVLLTSDQKKEYNKLITDLTFNLRTDFEKLHNAGDIKYKNERGGFSLTTIEFENSRGEKRGNYELIRTTYKTHLDLFYQGFLNLVGGSVLRKSNSSNAIREVKDAGKAFNLSHIGEDANVYNFVADGVQKTLEAEMNFNGVDREVLEQLGLSDFLTVVKGEKTLIVKIGDRLSNAIQGAGEEQKFLTDLKKAIAKIDVITMPGSDSFSDINKKKALKKVVNSFRKIKNIQITTEDLKLDIKSTPQNKTISSKAYLGYRAEQKVSGKRKTTFKGRETQPSFSPLQLLADLNRQLPSVVAENMDAPALQNQTGRFASSVRATDINQTPQGFLSVGYTYMKEPYQTFEMGYTQGSTLRDPRKLIDVSIREIAAQHALGRLYTRRV